MATQVTNYQCPACTGPLHFSGETGKLECDYCSSSYDVSEIEALYAEKDKKAAEIFSFLKFGQPGAIVLQNGHILMSHWFAEQGQNKPLSTEIEL